MNVLTTKVKTISDLMSIALKAEREAIRRYSLLATTMREGGNESSADLFERMVMEGQEHEQWLLAWMTKEGVDESLDIEPINWHDPNICTAYKDEACDPYQSSPYKVLAFAVHNEEIAFRRYTHVAANSENEAVCQYAEVLAREELGHMALLKAERRRAYHAERDANKIEPRLNPGAVHNEVDLLAAAIHVDQLLVNEMNKVIGKLPEMTSLARETQLAIDSNKGILHDRAMNRNEAPNEDITRNITQIKSHNDHMEENTGHLGSEIQQLYAYCDRSFAFYSAVVETTPDEAVMFAAQKLTSLELDRLEVLRKVFSKKHGGVD